MQEAILRGNLSFARETWKGFRAEAAPLFELHWREIARSKSLLRLDPYDHLYALLEQYERLAVITARHEGRLVGYFVWFLGKHLHYQEVLMADEDIHFLLPQFRRGLNGYNLIKYAIEMVKPLGIRYFQVREKQGHEHPAIMRRLGLKPTDVTYSLALEN